VRSKNDTPTAQQRRLGITPPGTTGSLLAKQLARTAFDITAVLDASRTSTAVGKLHLHHRVQDTRFDTNIEATIRKLGLGHLLSSLIENVYDSHIVYSVIVVLLKQKSTARRRSNITTAVRT
jgi:hypothetical protein